MEEEIYEDIIHMPHHQSQTRPHMSLVERAAQFSPFAALSGYDEGIREAGSQIKAEYEIVDDTSTCL